MVGPCRPAIDHEVVLTAIDGSIVTVSLPGWQFPNVQRRPDAGWLMVEGHISTANDAWSFLGPFLETQDIPWIAGWLDQLAVGKADRQRLDFNEPEIAFLARPDLGPTGFAMLLDRRARPPSQGRRMIGDDPYVLEFLLPPDAVHAAADSLRGCLEQIRRH